MFNRITEKIDGYTIFEKNGSHFLFDIENMFFCTISSELSHKIEKKEFELINETEKNF